PSLPTCIEVTGRASRTDQVGLGGLDHDALSRAFFGRLDREIDQIVGCAGDSAGAVAPGVGIAHAIEHLPTTEVLLLLLDHPQAVVTWFEDVRAYLGADPITRAQVLVDPDHELRFACH